MPVKLEDTSGATPPPSPLHTSESETRALSLVAERNLAVAMSLRATAWRLAEAGLRTFRPELSEAEVQAEVRAQFRRAAG